MDLIKAIEAEQIKDNEIFGIGDTIKVFFKIIEGTTERKMSFGVGVERVFPFNSPRIQKIEVVKYGKVRRSKLYYLRDRVGKAAKIKELIKKKEETK